MDPRDAVRDAQLRLRKLAAASEVRAEKARAALARLRADAERLGADRAALAAADRPEAAEAETLLAELSERIRTAELELFEAERVAREAQHEQKAVGGLIPELERAEARRITAAALSDEPGGEDAVARALENVRHHIDSLEAEAALGAELAPAGAPPPAPPDPRAQLEALKAARAGRGAEPDARTPAEPGHPAKPSPAGKPKRTL